MADINVGGVKATVSLDATQFEKGINSVVTSLESMNQSFQQSQTNVANRVSRITKSITDNSKLINASVKDVTQAINYMSSDVHSGFDILHREVTEATRATVKSSKEMSSSFRQISNALNGLHSGFTNLSARVTHNSKVMSNGLRLNVVAFRQLRDSAEQANASLGSIDRNITQGFRGTTSVLNQTLMTLRSVVTELQTLRTVMQGVQTTMATGFANSINAFGNSMHTNTNRVVRDLQTIGREAQNTNALLAQAPRGGGNGGNGRGNGGGGGGNGNGMFDWLRGLSGNNTFQGLVTQAEAFSTRLGEGLNTFNQMTVQAYLLRRGIEDVVAVVEALVKPAVQFNAQMETLQLGYAGIISSTMKFKETGENVSYNDALDISNSLLSRMQDEALKTSLTINELGSALQATMAMGLNAGMSLENVLDLTVVGAQAVKTFGLSNQQVIQELRGLISGEAIRPGVDQLATVLGYTTATVNKLREEGKLYEDIKERMVGFARTSDEFQNTWAGLTSNIEDGIARISGVAGQSMYETFKKSLKEFQGIFFTVDEISRKPIINKETATILKSVFDIIENLWKIIVVVSKAIGAVLVPVLKIVLSSLSGLVRLVAFVVQAFDPFIAGLQVIGGVIGLVWDKIVQWTEALVSMVTGILGANEGVITFASTLGVLLLAFVAITNPIGAVIALISGIGLAFGYAKEPTTTFGKWLKAFFDNLLLNAQLFWAKLKAVFTAVTNIGTVSLKDLFTGNVNFDKLLDDAYSQQGVNALENRIEQTHAALLYAGKQLKSDFYNVAKGFKEGTKGLDAWGITGKYTADKQKKAPKEKGSAKNSYRNLEDAQKDLVKKLKEGSEQLKALYKNDLVSAQDYAEGLYKIKLKEIEAEEEMIKKKLEVAKAKGSKSDIETFTDALKGTKTKKDNAQLEFARNLSEVYKKLEERLQKINKAYQDMVGETPEMFKNNLAKSVADDYARLSVELETYKKRIDAGDTSKDWNEKQVAVTKAMNALKNYIAMKGLQNQVSMKNAEIERANLQIQEKNLALQVRADAGNYSSLVADINAWREKKKNLSSYLENYQKLISYYKEMEKYALRDGNLEFANKYKRGALEAEQAMRELMQAVHPLRRELQDTFSSGMADAYQSVLWGEKSILDAMKDFSKNLAQTFTKRIFDEVFKGVTDDLFNGIFPKSKMGGVSVEVQANVDGFVKEITAGAVEFKARMTQDLVPSFTNLATLINNTVIPSLTNLANGVGGNTGGTGQGVASGANGVALAQSTQGALENSKDFNETLKSHMATVKQNAKAVAKNTSNVDKNSNNSLDNTLAIGMMATSLLSATGASEKFQKALMILQAAMTIMSIGKSFLGWGGKAEGGLIEGKGTGTSDSILARLSNGEYVMKASTVRKYGSGFFDSLNYGYSRGGRLPKFAFAEGGYVSESQSSIPASSNSMVNNSAPVVNLNMSFQSIDPQQNMKLLEQEYPRIRSMLIKDLNGNSSMRSAVKGVK